MSNGRYPPWGTSPEWDDVLRDKERLADCERYSCRPSELAEEDWHELERHRAIEAAEMSFHERVRQSSGG